VVCVGQLPLLLTRGEEPSVCVVCSEVVLCCTVLTWPNGEAFGSVLVCHVKHCMCLERFVRFVGL